MVHTTNWDQKVQFYYFQLGGHSKGLLGKNVGFYSVLLYTNCKKL